MLDIIATGLAWLAIAFNDGGMPPPSFSEGIGRSTAVVSAGFIGREWPCDALDVPDANGQTDGETCYAGVIIIDDRWTLQTGP